VTICLALNVKDEAVNIERCIRSALPVIDQAVIIDTGCTDDTIAIARTVLNGTPCDFHEREWVNHGVNRTDLLGVVRDTGADYTLMLDADMELVIEKGGWPDVLDADEYTINIRSRGLNQPLPLLTSTRKRFKYSGVTHVYLECDDPPVHGLVMPQDKVYLIDHGFTKPGKIERDAELLAAEVGKNPADTRSWFYLAQTYRDLDRVPEAIAAYKVRAMLGGWQEEVYWSLYMAGTLLSEHVNFYEGAKMLIAAAEMKKNRAEALRALAGLSASVADKIPFPETEHLFVEPGAYTHRTTTDAEEIFFHRYTPKAGDVVVELGAGDGTETREIAALVGDTGLVVAVDGTPAASAVLAAACGGMPNVRVVEAAVAAADGTVRMTADGNSRDHIVTDGGVEVPAVTLDSITSDLPRVDLLKVNIEGAETDVLRAATVTLAKTRNAVVSCHDFIGIATKADVCALLTDAGFDVTGHSNPLVIPDGHGGRCLGDFLYATRPAVMPPMPDLTASPTRKKPRVTAAGLDPRDVTAIIPTRGNVDILTAGLPYGQVIVWDNSKQPDDYKVFARYVAVQHAARPVIYWQDDDVIFTEHAALLAAYEPGMIVSNMDPVWINGAGYQDGPAMVGAGALCDATLVKETWDRYFAVWPFDDDVLLECDFAFGTLAPWKRVNLGYQIREFADDPDRLYQAPGQTERKWRMIERARAMLTPA
jgi:FkbM family methyltransferase